MTDYSGERTMDIIIDQIKFTWNLLSTPLFELGNR
jgi:hypothetical protein